MKRVASDVKRVVIVGAGAAGRDTLQVIRRNHISAIQVIGFIDDEKKRHSKIFGVPVLGTIHDLRTVTKQRKIDQILIAVPSAEGGLIRRVINSCNGARVSFRIVPRLLEIIQGGVKIDHVRDVQPEDLLGRAIVKSEQRALHSLFAGKTILITGAAGSIGSELCRQLVEYRPKLLVALDWWENGLYDFDLKLRERHPKLVYQGIIANVQDREKIARIMRRYRPDFVFHAAAYKHVPLMEQHPEEAVKNNILGTWNVANAAKRQGVKKFILISTDKAVNPTSVMGATKAIAEILVHSLNGGKTVFSSVRFGNVLSSNGSVVPLFQRQIRNGGPVTITHPDIVRFFMSIPEAVQLILQATRLTAHGEVFVLDMGEPVKILDLARNLIRLSGFRPDVEIPIQFTGLRPGEKLYEEFLTQQEGIRSTRNRNVFITTTAFERPYKAAKILRDAANLGRHGSPAAIREFLRSLLPTYRPKR